MKNHIRKHILTAFLILIALSCFHYSVDELMSAPVKIEINEREYILDTYLYRASTFPGPLSGLGGEIYIIAIDSLEIPSSLNAHHLYVINGNDVWESQLTNPEIPNGQTYILKMDIEDEGPDWGPEIYVNVVVEVEDDLETESIWLLRADSQYISGVY
ncbi:MAG TPA: hypothetical protein VF399_09970 [bacterium]